MFLYPQTLVEIIRQHSKIPGYDKSELRRELQRIEAVLEEIKDYDTSEYLETKAAVIVAYHLLGDPEGAHSLLSVYQSLHSDVHEYESWKVLSAFADALHACGYDVGTLYRKAIDETEGMVSGFLGGDDTIGKIIHSMADRGYFEEARDILNSLPDDIRAFSKPKLFAYLARAQMRLATVKKPLFEVF